MIVTCEPTFFAKVDSTTPPVRRLPESPPASTAAPSRPDPVFTAKEDFIRKHNLVVWRFSDHWRLHKPDAFVQGLAGTLGWSKFVETADSTRFTLPEMTLDALVSHVKRSLNARGGMRVVGDPRLPVRKVALIPGTTAIQASIETLPEVDAIIAGEVREWESVEYVRDTVDLGGKKSLILVGRILSEGPGMQLCAQWLKTIVPEVTSTSIPVADPYWRPRA
jgi:putative NIF3 family GTP cyclohydrolase 1 type 2